MFSHWSPHDPGKPLVNHPLLPAQNTGHLCKVPNFQNPDLFSIHIPRLANKQLNQRNYYVLFNASWRILFLPTFYFYNVICINRHDVCIINIKELWKSYLDIYLFSIGMMSIMSDCWWTHFSGDNIRAGLVNLSPPMTGGRMIGGCRWKSRKLKTLAGIKFRLIVTDAVYSHPVTVLQVANVKSSTNSDLNWKCLMPCVKWPLHWKGK